MLEAVEAFYDRNPQHEWERLERHRTEFVVTLRALVDWLPPPPVKILDIGGRPGRYAIELTKRGYEVVLFDLSRGCLELAREKAREAGVELAGYEHGNAIYLSRFKGEEFDATLLMGPLYHLLEEEDRRAVREAHRVLKPGGLIFAAFITRYAPIRWAAKYEPEWIIAHRERLERLLTSGQLPAHPGESFTDTWFAHPTEIRPLTEGEGFETLGLIACEGLVSMIEEKVNELSGKLWDAWVELNYRLGKGLSIHGAAEHLLYIGRKCR